MNIFKNGCKFFIGGPVRLCGGEKNLEYLDNLELLHLFTKF